ncbi:Bax inhibitor-1/YccA family protein [Schaalia hyovaginalis]|uniref:Bax inhibitor-1/YccA family protein n=1 Tax=Schaalia hyovaginalis TaxID=29316 RepID=UPI0026EB0B06|nr:Bax inhibitor-1/YccA family protein [Schaalia hyovaginalis]MCI7512758.1 Bax inhibitor-1/YccA family protein [Schaalia hyovaginalis]
MSNPVFNKLEREWAAQSYTPNGYPTMPGYTPGARAESAQAPTSPEQAASASRAPRSWDAALPSMEQAYASPAADAVDRGRMTYDDVVVKSGISLGVLLIAAVASWTAVVAAPGVGMLLVLAGLVGGFILAMVNSFSKTIRPALVLAYAAFEGSALGGVSAVFEGAYPGIVVQALLATAAVFTVTLALFASGRVRNSSTLMRFTLIGLIGILVYRVLSMILTMTGVISSGFDSMTIMGIPLGLVVGVLAVLIGAFSLIQDFDQVKVGVQRGVPEKHAWACAFGILVTVVWMYLEILRLIAILRDN